MVAEVSQTFWASMARGEFITGAAAEAGTYRQKGRRWLRESGGVRPRRGRDLKGRCLTFAEREEIAIAHAGGQGVRQIALGLGRSPSTVCRELQRNVEGAKSYRATTAHALAYVRASRPKAAKLAMNVALRAKVENDLEKKYSPEQITGRLRVEFPDDPEMRVSPETIYQSLYVQARGRKVGQRKNRIPNMINIAQRPPEVEDRAVPGNWEGDLIIGKANQTAIGTLVERSTGYVMLLHLPDGYKPEQVRDVLAAKIKTVPDSLRLSLTWDQGPQMRDWKHVSIDAGIDIYFCDPHAPGNAVRMKTRTACCASISRRAPT